MPAAIRYPHRIDLQRVHRFWFTPPPQPELVKLAAKAKALRRVYGLEKQADRNPASSPSTSASTSRPSTGSGSATTTTTSSTANATPSSPAAPPAANSNPTANSLASGAAQNPGSATFSPSMPVQNWANWIHGSPGDSFQNQAIRLGTFLSPQAMQTLTAGPGATATLSPELDPRYANPNARSGFFLPFSHGAPMYSMVQPSSNSSANNPASPTAARLQPYTLPVAVVSGLGQAALNSERMRNALPRNISGPLRGLTAVGSQALDVAHVGGHLYDAVRREGVQGLHSGMLAARNERLQQIWEGVEPGNALGAASAALQLGLEAATLPVRPVAMAQHLYGVGNELGRAVLHGEGEFVDAARDIREIARLDSYLQEAQQRLQQMDRVTFRGQTFNRNEMNLIGILPAYQRWIRAGKPEGTFTDPVTHQQYTTLQLMQAETWGRQLDQGRLNWIIAWMRRQGILDPAPTRR